MKHVLGIILILVGLMAGAAGSGRTGVDEVREFLRDPPIIERLLLRRTLTVSPVSFPNERVARRFVARVAAGEVTLPGATSLFEIRFQAEPPAFFLRALDEVLDLDDVGVPRRSPFAGRFRGDWWSIPAVGPGQIQLLRSTNGMDVTAEGVTNSFHHGNERWATEYLRLGMFEVLTGSLQWTGDGRFRAALESGGECRGEVTAGDEAGGARIVLRPVHAGLGTVIEVLGTNVSGRWLPADIFVRRVGQEADRAWTNDYARMEALGVTLADRPLTRERFSPEPYLRTNDLWVELERGRHYQLQMQGTNLVRTLVSRGSSRWGIVAWARYLLPALGLVGGVLVFGSLVRGWRERRGVIPRG